MRTRALAIAVLGAAAVVAGPGVASAGTAHTLKAIETFTGTVPKDAGTKGVPVGDRLTYTTELKDLKGVKLGVVIGECTHVTGSTGTDGLYNCLETIRLHGGDVVTTGIFSFESTGIQHFSITGGTEKYRGATGDEDLTTQKDGSFADTFHFDS